MEVLVILALVVGFFLCLLPGIMSWHYHFGSTRPATRKHRVYFHRNLHQHV